MGLINMFNVLTFLREYVGRDRVKDESDMTAL